jgi:hypothetical protein
MLLIPIWFCLSEEIRERLRAFQRRHYQQRLTIPAWPFEVETLAEIAKLMRIPTVMEKKPK